MDLETLEVAKQQLDSVLESHELTSLEQVQLHRRTRDNLEAIIGFHMTIEGTCRET